MIFTLTTPSCSCTESKGTGNVQPNRQPATPSASLPGDGTKSSLAGWRLLQAKNYLCEHCRDQMLWPKCQGEERTAPKVPNPAMRRWNSPGITTGCCMLLLSTGKTLSSISLVCRCFWAALSGSECLEPSSTSALCSFGCSAVSHPDDAECASQEWRSIMVAKAMPLPWTINKIKDYALG